MSEYFSLSSGFWLLHFGLFVALLLRVLARNDLNSGARIAWVLVMFGIPIAGILLYLLVGEVHFGEAARRRFDAAIATTRQAANASGTLDVDQKGTAHAFTAAIDGFGVTQGNRGELMPSPEAARTRLIDDIDAARESVNLLYYIWLDDNTGTATAEALMRAARRGLKCRAMVDAVGSHHLIQSRLWREMAAAGVETEVALPIGNPLRTMFSRRLDLRNHRKISVIDRAIAYCGSQNCADPEFLPKRRFAPWVDIMVRFEGPVVAQMLLMFAQDWLVRRPSTPVSEFVAQPPPFHDGFEAQAVATGPIVGRLITEQLFSRLIYDARRELTISTPYFVPGDTVCSALCGAARTGVAVTLIVPHRNDSVFVAAASRSYYPQLVQAGVRIAEFNGGLLHSKTITVDEELTFMGSSNMDFRSFDLNFENDVLFRDSALTADIRARQAEYLASSTPVSRADVEAWPLWRRIWLNAFAAMGPVL